MLKLSWMRWGLEILGRAQNSAFSDLGEKGEERLGEFLPLLDCWVLFFPLNFKKSLICSGKKTVLLREYHPRFDKAILMLFWRNPYAKRLLFWPPPLGFSLSLLLHTGVSATAQARTFIWLKPSLCCRASVPSPCTLISRHRWQSSAIAYLHTVMLLLADAPPAIPEIFSLCWHREAANSSTIDTGTCWAAASLGCPVDLVYGQIRPGPFHTRRK